MSALLKKLYDRSAFEQAVYDLLGYANSGHLGPYMYTDDVDDHRWKDGHSSESYYLGRDDKATFDLMIQELDIESHAFIDLGPGGQDSVAAKSMKMLDALRAKQYLPVDMSATLAHQAASFVSDNRKINSQAVVSDFFAPLPINPREGTISIMGGTIGNIETYLKPEFLQIRLSEVLANFRNVVTLHSHFIVSFDANDNGQEVLDCYTSPQFDHLIHSCLNRAIDANDFTYEPVWTSENYQLALGLRSDRDQIVRFSGGEFAIEKGEFFPILNSYRYPVPFFIQAANLAGWKHKKTWSASGRTHYLLFEAF